MALQFLKQRIIKIRRNIDKSGFGYALLTSPANVSYVTGFTGEDSWALLKKNKVWLITDSRYTEQAKLECSSCNIVERSGSLVSALFDIILSFDEDMSTIGVDYLTPGRDIEAIKKKTEEIGMYDVGLISNEISTVRMKKDETEIENIKKAAQIAQKSLKNAFKSLKVGMSESEFAGLIEFEMRKLGSTASFDTIVAFGANGSMPHYQPGKQKLKANDTILIDWGSKSGGYISDMTRCFAVGKVSEDYDFAYKTVLKAQKAAIEAVKAGVNISTVDQAAREVIREANLPEYGHGTGHGIGLDVHERPIISSHSSNRLLIGQVITIEPGVYLPGKFGIRIEDDVLVTKDGCEILTRGKTGPKLETVL